MFDFSLRRVHPSAKKSQKGDKWLFWLLYDDKIDGLKSDRFQLVHVASL